MRRQRRTSRARAVERLFFASAWLALAAAPAVHAQPANPCAARNPCAGANPCATRTEPAADAGGAPPSMVPLSPASPNPPELDALMDEFLATGEALEGRPGGEEAAQFPGPPERPNWFQVLRVTRDENPLLERRCKEKALELSVDSLALEMHAASEAEALRAATEHMREHQNFIRENRVSHADYLREIAECRSFCAPLVAQLVQCHILAVARLEHGIVLFDLDSDVVDPRYTEGLLANSATQLRSDAERKIVLIGRASQIGDLRYNRTLSARRTLAVKDALTELGVPADRIEAMWFGWEPPQISFQIATEYGLAELFEAEGMQRLNQSVMLVIYP